MSRACTIKQNVVLDSPRRQHSIRASPMRTDADSISPATRRPSSAVSKRAWQGVPPDPRNADEFADWGRQRFGEEWAQKQQTMLKERNIYVRVDYRYKKRQEELRAMEQDVEGCLFPRGGLQSAVSRRSLSPARPTRSGPRSWAPSDSDSDHESARSRPHTRGMQPRWISKKTVQAQRIAEQRSLAEDAIGNRQLERQQHELNTAREQLKALPLARNSVAYQREFDAVNRKADRLEKLQRGLPRDAVELAYTRAEELVQARNKAEDELLQRGPTTPDELAQKLKLWQKYGLAVDEHDRLVALYGFGPIPRPDYTVVDDDAYEGYDYLSLCKRTPKSRPQPSEKEMLALAETWRTGLILNNKEISELLVMHGFDSLVQKPSTPSTPPPPSSLRTSRSLRRNVRQQGDRVAKPAQCTRLQMSFSERRSPILKISDIKVSES